VTSRAIELTPTMTSILMTHATESACIAVARQFASPIGDRSLLTMVEETTQPLASAASLISLQSENQGDWKTLSLVGELDAGPYTFSLVFENPYGTWTGTDWLDRRELYVDSLTVISPSGFKQTIRGNDLRLVTSYQKNGLPSCHPQSGGYSVCFNGSLSFDMTVTEPGRYIFETLLSSKLAPSLEGYVKVRLAMRGEGDILKATTKSAQLIKRQISALFEKLHGTRLAVDSDEITQVYEIFAAALTVAQESDGSEWRFENCKTWDDGYFDWDLLSKEQVESYKSPSPNGDYYEDDWSIKGSLLRPFTQDPLGTKYAWTAVMMYMLSHYDYLHE